MSTIELLAQVKQLPPREQLLLAEKILTGLADQLPNEIAFVPDQDNQPPIPATATRVAGLHAGMAWVSDDFDEPLPDEFWLGEK